MAASYSLESRGRRYLHFQSSESRRDVLAVASSTATLSIFRLKVTRPYNQSPELEPASVIRIKGVGDDVLFLSCAWHPSVPDTIAVTTSTGAVHVMTIDMDQRYGFFPPAAVLTHTLETWTVAFSPFTSQLSIRADSFGEDKGVPDSQQAFILTTLYSGSDDSLLQYTSCILPTSSSSMDSVPHPTPFVSRKLNGHGAGVTAILPTSVTIAGGSQIVVTGSYDDYIRVFSIPDSTVIVGDHQATCLAKQDLGGGVWRLKLISQSTSSEARRWTMRIMASCMHAGVRVVDIDGDNFGSCQITVAARFEEHKSMNYGSDFLLKDPLLCISTSFYDKLLCIWELKSSTDGTLVQQDNVSDNP
ncbi:hypothetical protein SEPCBS57363_006212 [Sporothrix epigloea]|uniref:WD repeat protein n=1 Tax=Sporothrix epigloea TaxID=1892477 RepID=A0ABP0E1U6_9PEZI